MDNIIQTDNLTRVFGPTVAVDRLTLSVRRGEIFGLLGHNGAGKTTTVRLLNGVLTPTAGRANVLGLSPLDDGPVLRRRTGVLTETPSLYEPLSARANLRLFAELYGIAPDEIARRVEVALERFGLAGRAGEKVGGYSKGMKQRLALARAFLHEPELLFLDEPTAGLDPLAAREVNDLIVHLSRQQGRTIILTTHNLHDAQALCDRVAVIEHGRLMALGSPAELAQHLQRSPQVEIEVGVGQGAQAGALLRARLDGAVQADDRRLRLTGVAYETIPDLVAALTGAGVRVYRVVPGQPTLEEVYFALHQEGER